MSVHPSSAATYPWEIEHERVGINIISTSDANRKYSHKSGNRIMYLRENEYPKNTCIYNGGDGGGVKKWRPMTRTGWRKAPCSSHLGFACVFLRLAFSGHAVVGE